MARSNRKLTQLMCDALREYRLFQRTDPVTEFGNTRIEYEPLQRGYRACKVFLFGSLILECLAYESEIRAITIYNGNFFDGRGRPSRTTRERLNGILAQAGETGLIPSGVRVFIDKDTQQCCVGKGDHCHPLDRDHETVAIKPDPTDLRLF